VRRRDHLDRLTHVAQRKGHVDAEAAHALRGGAAAELQPGVELALDHDEGLGVDPVLDRRGGERLLEGLELARALELVQRAAPLPVALDKAGSFSALTRSVHDLRRVGGSRHVVRPSRRSTVRWSRCSTWPTSGIDPETADGRRGLAPALTAPRVLQPARRTTCPGKATQVSCRPPLRPMVRFWPPAPQRHGPAAPLPAVLSPALPAMLQDDRRLAEEHRLRTRAGRAHLEGRVGDEARAGDLRHGLLRLGHDLSGVRPPAVFEPLVVDDEPQPATTSAVAANAATSARTWTFRMGLSLPGSGVARRRCAARPRACLLSLCVYRRRRRPA